MKVSTPTYFCGHVFTKCHFVVDTPVSKGKHNQHACIDLTPIEWYYYSTTTLFCSRSTTILPHWTIQNKMKTAEDCMYFPVPPFSGGYSVQKLWHQHCVVVLRMAPWLVPEPYTHFYVLQKRKRRSICGIRRGILI